MQFIRTNTLIYHARQQAARCENRAKVYNSICSDIPQNISIVNDPPPGAVNIANNSEKWGGKLLRIGIFPSKPANLFDKRRSHNFFAVLVVAVAVVIIAHYAGMCHAPKRHPYFIRRPIFQPPLSFCSFTARHNETFPLILLFFLRFPFIFFFILCLLFDAFEWQISCPNRNFSLGPN